MTDKFCNEIYRVTTSKPYNPISASTTDAEMQEDLIHLDDLFD